MCVFILFQCPLSCLILSYLILYYPPPTNSHYHLSFFCFFSGVMNAPSSVVFPGHTTFEWALAVSAFAVGGPGGAVLGGYLANKKGRRGRRGTYCCSNRI